MQGNIFFFLLQSNTSYSRGHKRKHEEAVI